MSTASARDVAIVVPHPRLELTAAERLSLRHLETFLPGYDRFLVLPESVPDTLPGFTAQRFPDRYFASRVAYSALLVARRFYEAFAAYRYILVYQLDALVFSDDLLDWCGTGLDYVGAPWIDVDWYDGEPEVGNGGFSLRRIEAFLDVLDAGGRWIEPAEYWRRHWADKPWPVRLRNLPRRYAKLLPRYNSPRWATENWLYAGLDATYGRHEDAFWSFEAQRFSPAFRRATVEEGLRFAFESAPRTCFELTGHVLPFGCHAWETFDRAFWEPYLLAEV